MVSLRVHSRLSRDLRGKKRDRGGGGSGEGGEGEVKYFQGVAGLFSHCYQRECGIRSFQPLAERFTIKRVWQTPYLTRYSSRLLNAGCISDNVVPCRRGFSTQRRGKRKKEEREETGGGKNWGEVSNELPFNLHVQSLNVFCFFFCSFLLRRNWKITM